MKKDRAYYVAKQLITEFVRKGVTVDIPKMLKEMTYVYILDRKTSIDGIRHFLSEKNLKVQTPFGDAKNITDDWVKSMPKTHPDYSYGSFVWNK